MTDPNDRNNPPWEEIKSQLKSALNSWEDLAKKHEGVPSAEEQKLKEMRDLLEELKDKIADLSKP